METIQTHRDPCTERAIVAVTLTDWSADEADDRSAAVTLQPHTPGRVRPVKLIQHPSFLRTADLGPDPRFTLAGRAPHVREQLSRAC